MVGKVPPITLLAAAEVLLSICLISLAYHTLTRSYPDGDSYMLTPLIFAHFNCCDAEASVEAEIWVFVTVYSKFGPRCCSGPCQVQLLNMLLSELLWSPLQRQCI